MLLHSLKSDTFRATEFGHNSHTFCRIQDLQYFSALLYQKIIKHNINQQYLFKDNVNTMQWPWQWSLRWNNYLCILISIHNLLCNLMSWKQRKKLTRDSLIDLVIMYVTLIKFKKYPLYMYLKMLAKPYKVNNIHFKHSQK